MVLWWCVHVCGCLHCPFPSLTTTVHNTYHPIYLPVYPREEEAQVPHGHITSLAVLRTHRKCGIATRLMQASRTWLTWLMCRLGARDGGARACARSVMVVVVVVEGHCRGSDDPPMDTPPQSVAWRRPSTQSTFRCTSARATARPSTSTRRRSATSE